MVAGKRLLCQPTDVNYGPRYSQEVLHGHSGRDSPRAGGIAGAALEPYLPGRIAFLLRILRTVLRGYADSSGHISRPECRRSRCGHVVADAADRLVDGRPYSAGDASAGL